MVQPIKINSSNSSDVGDNVDYEKRLLILQRDILELIAKNNAHDENLKSLCLAAEQMLPNSVASIMLYDNDNKFLNVRCAPSLPEKAVEQLNGIEPSECAGSCGAAVFSNSPVYVENTATDERWKLMRDFATEFNIEACWSNPIISGEPSIIGSFALSSFESKRPTEFQKNLLSICAYLAGLVVQRERMEACLWRQANYDPLTMLPNRDLLYNFLQKIIKESAEHDRKAALMFIDLDNFKDINDCYGHAVGDQVLIDLAKAMNSSIRDGGMISRTGGDEFVVVLKDLKAMNDVVSIAQKILDAAINVKHAENIHATLSIGVSVCPDDAINPHDLLRNADTAMYAAKASGKNNYHFYSAELTEKIIAKLTLKHELLHAIENDELYLLFQPIVDSKSKSVVSAEALVRWNHPKKGTVSPDEFIPLAEEYGLINDITNWVISNACKLGMELFENLDSLNKISINFSASEINSETFQNLINIIEAEKFPPEKFEIEITETMFMTHGEVAIDQLNKAKDYGISISMDDFGTGYSSLYQIHRLPINKLKIDREFIKELPAHNKHTKLTNVIIDMAKTFSLQVVAEGVEAKEQEEFLIAEGCDYLQGYYFYKPISVDDFKKL